ncbi:MAG: head-tail connector protein [Eubacteriales bacterium]|nr:head-tail connector protein [Eubacteriales bacterium]
MLEKLMSRLPDERDETLLSELLEDAAAFILAYTGRSSVPQALENAQLQLAVVYYNRRGMEGESQRSEGGVDRTVDALPRDIAAMLNPFRLAKAVGSCVS